MKNLPTPNGYQEISVEMGANGVRYLYMGYDFVPFTESEWRKFLREINNA